MMSAVPSDQAAVDRLVEHEVAQHDPDDRQQVGDERRPGRAPVGEQAEDQQVRDARPEHAQPQDREDRLGVRRGGPRVLEDDREGRDDDRREGHLEDRRDHRRQAAHVAPRVDRAGGIAEGGAEERQLAGQRRLVAGQPRARDDDHADEPDEQADQAVHPDRLVGEEDAPRARSRTAGPGDVRIAASDDSTEASAQVMSRNGIVMLMIAITSRWP